MLGRQVSMPIISQVTMIESKFEKQDVFAPSRKVNLPATLFNRSPQRRMPGGVVSPNRGLTPSRLQDKVVSPVRFRKHSPGKLSTYFSQSSLMTSNQTHTRHKSPAVTNDPYCESNTHPSKIATFTVETDDGQMPYCEKCSILLASQGFKVSRLEKPGPLFSHNKLQSLCQLQNPQRRSELMAFLNQVQMLGSTLAQRKSQVQTMLKANNGHFKKQQAIIQQYFAHLRQTIDIQKSGLIQEFRGLQKEINDRHEVQLRLLNTHITDCNSMKEDIYESVQIIRQVDNPAFERVISAYKTKARDIKGTARPIEKNENLPRIVGDSAQDVSRRIVGLLDFRVETNNKDAQQPNYFKNRQSSVYFSFDNAPTQSMVVSTQPIVASGHSGSQVEDSNNKSSQALKTNSNLDYEYGQFDY